MNVMRDQTTTSVRARLLTAPLPAALARTARITTPVCAQGQCELHFEPNE
jgi:hypothetical protein